ncbi:MAG: hypothetical protein GTO60_17070, partial [Gammaproteobacteria bacterium]|nr:hypothetical protein [Gammaproteobacteria bacterium]
KLSREYVIEEQVNDVQQVLKSIVTSLPAETIDNQTYYPHHYASGEIYYFNKSDKGVSVSHEPGQAGNIILGYPLVLGTSWQTETRIGILDQR